MTFKGEHMSNVTVVVGTFGEESVWEPLARRAMASVERQTVLPDEILWVHRDSLQEARNTGAEMAGTEWLIFLDADDELDQGYVEAMLRAPGDLRRPMTLGVYEDGSEDAAPIFIPRKPLLEANFIVIGAMCRREQFLRLGGFDDYPMLEDWALWLKMACDGAEIADAHGAIYRVHVRPDSRNTGGNLANKTYSRIQSRFREEARGKRL